MFYRDTDVVVLVLQVMNGAVYCICNVQYICYDMDEEEDFILDSFWMFIWLFPREKGLNGAFLLLKVSVLLK